MTSTFVLTADECGRLLKIGASRPGDRIRELFREGKFPAPIDESLAAREWRWSSRVVDRYVNPPIMDSDPTPPHGVERPDLSAVAS